MASRRNTEPCDARADDDTQGEAPIRELDRVRLLAAVIGDSSVKVPIGSTGTVVAIYAQGEAYEVEFTQPVEALATVDSRQVLLVQRATE